MLYVKVVTPLALKRWVWPKIKCSHLTPKLIYSNIDDLVIANCLLDARLFVHASSHISFAILLCEHVDCIFYSFEDIRLLLWLICSFSFAKWMDKNATSQSLIKSDSNNSVWGALGVPNLSTVHLGMTDSSISVTPSSLSWSRFSISVQPIWTFWSHRIEATACDSASRCHQVVPLGHTDRVRMYIPTGEIFGNFFKTLHPARVLLYRLGSLDRLLVVGDLLPLVSIVVNGILPRRCRRSELTAELGYEFDPLC